MCGSRDLAVGILASFFACGIQVRRFVDGLLAGARHCASPEMTNLVRCALLNRKRLNSYIRINLGMG